RGLEIASGFHPDVGVVIAEPLIEIRLGLRGVGADAILDDAQIGDALGRHQLRVRQLAVVLLVIFVVGPLFDALRIGLLATLGLCDRWSADQTNNGTYREDAFHVDGSEIVAGFYKFILLDSWEDATSNC